ncbi:UPF0496 protein 4-like [Fagus crenata]
MNLTDIPHFLSFSPFKKHSHAFLKTKTNANANENTNDVVRAFEHSLLLRLKALNPPSISLSWLSLALDFISFTHTQARSLISNLNLSSDSDLDDSLAWYLDDHSVKLLDLCNSISSEIERLKHRRLFLNFLLQLLSPSDSNVPPSPEKLRRARDSLPDWDKNNNNNNGSRINKTSAPDLIRDLAAGLGTRGKISGAQNKNLLRRTILGVGSLTVYFSSVLVSLLYGSGSHEIVTVRVLSDEFSWADSFNSIQTELTRKFRERVKGVVLLFQEFDDVATRAREVCDVIDDDKKRTESLNDVVGELRKLTDVFSENLDRLSNSVNGMFDTVLCTRNGVLENVKVSGFKKEKPTKKQVTV